MNVIYSDKAKQRSEEYRLLQHATKFLDEVLGQSADEVKVEWDRGEDANGRAVYTLRLSDQTDSASGSLSLDELQSDNFLRFRLNRLWDGLLAPKGHRILRGLRESGE